MTDEPRAIDSLAGPITFALLILIGFLAIHSIEPPPAVDENAPATEFSAAREMRDVREIAKKPHPLGSAEHDRVSQYLYHRLFELIGGRPMPFYEQVTVARHSPLGPDTWAAVNNVGIYLRGTDSTGTVLMTAHYDSVPSGPGAGDNAASVVALLGTVAAIGISGHPVRNDLIILFTDGEELGMLGAQGFVEDHSMADLPVKGVKVVLNFDMLGGCGPSTIYQTSAHNSWLIDQLAAAAPFPHGSSETASPYRRSMYESDFDVFLNAGMTGMNFAALGGITRYHTALDNADMLDQRTLQHQGSYAVSMARQFGSIDLNAPRSGDHDAVFFVAGGKLIHYSARLAFPLAILVTILVFGVMWIGIRSGRFSVGGIAVGVSIYTVALAFAGVEAIGLWWIVTTFAGWRMLPVQTTYGGFYYTVAVAALTFGTLWAAYEQMGQSIRPGNLGAGALSVWTVLMLATSISFQGGSFVLTWPLLFATLAIGWRALVTDERRATSLAILALVALVPGTAMIVPGRVPYATIYVLVAQGVAFALFFGLFIPYIDFLTSGRRWIVPGVLGVFALVMIIKGNAASNFDASQPHPDSIFYFLDTDRARARWVSLDSRPDSFTSQFFQHHVHGGWLPKLAGLATRETPDSNLASISRDFAYLNRGRTIEGDAPLINAAPPELKVLDDSTVAGERTVRMHIASARKASIVWMSVPVGVSVLGASIDGRSAGDRVTDGWSGWYWGAPANGFDLTLKIATPAPFVVTVIDQTDGLPETPGFVIKPRPPDTMPTPFLFFDSTTLVRKTFAIGGEQVTRC